MTAYNVSSFVHFHIIESSHKKTNDLYMRKQRRRSVTAQLISTFVFATRIVLFLFYLCESFTLLLYAVTVQPGLCRKPKLFVFSCTGSYSVKFRLLSGHIWGNNCYLILSYVLFVLVPLCLFVCFPRAVRPIPPFPFQGILHD